MPDSQLTVTGEDPNLRITRVCDGYEASSAVYMLTGPRDAVAEYVDRVVGEDLGMGFGTVTDLEDLDGWIAVVFNASEAVEWL